MKLFRIGHYQDKGITPLADGKLELKPSTLFNKGWELLISLAGIEGKTTYNYHVQFSANELALFVETALIGASQDGAIHAQAKAMGAFIREVLDKKNKPADT